MDKLHLENQSLTPPENERMSPKKGGRFFQKEVNHLDLFSWIFRGNSDIRVFSGIC